MKKISSGYKAWMCRHSAKCARSRLREKAIRAARRRGTKLVRVYQETAEGRPKRIWAESRTPMPGNFCLLENYEETAGILVKLRDNLLKSTAELVPGLRRSKKGRIKGFLDFATMKDCSLAAALVLASEYDRARAVRPFGITLINLDQWDPMIIDFFDAIGFFDLLKIRRPSVAGVTSEWRIQKFQTGELVGSKQAGSLTQALAQIIRDVGAVAGADVHRLYAALVEATENTCLHAYPEDACDTTIRRWWMAGAANPVNGQIRIVVYDQGVSIPARLNQWSRYGLIERGFRRLLGMVPPEEDHQYDATRMRLAMAAPLSSSSGLFHRGKGFPAFKDVVDQCKYGRLRIVSRRGEFAYESGRKPVGRVLNTPLNGTLIEWDLSL